MGWKSPWNTSILGRRFLGHLFLLHRRVANPSIHYWGDHPFPVQHWVRDGESRPYMGHNWLLDDDLPYNLWQKGWNRSCFHLLNSWTNKTSAFFEFFEAKQRSTEDEDLKKSLKITILFGFIWHQVYFVIVLDGHRGDFFFQKLPQLSKSQSTTDFGGYLNPTHGDDFIDQGKYTHADTNCIKDLCNANLLVWMTLAKFPPMFLEWPPFWIQVQKCILVAFVGIT